MAADVGTLALFPKVVGNSSFAREAAYTGRDFTAEEALQAGFLSAVIPGKKKEDVLGTPIISTLTSESCEYVIPI